MKWLLLGTIFTCGYLIGVEAGKKIFEDGLRKKSEELIRNLRVVPITGVKGGPSTVDDLIGDLFGGQKKKASEPGVS